jgi:BTB/POZ domain-containing protein KCTD9
MERGGGLGVGTRLGYEHSCRRVRAWEGEDVLRLPDHVPRSGDDAPLDVSFFRTLIEGEDLSNLTLPRTFFGRSEVNNVRFRNTDLSESNLCWNDFIDVDFSEATLAGCDARASLFSAVSFASADLSHADLRRSRFENCDFSGAEMLGPILTREQGASVTLSEKQKAAIAWTEDEGEQPEGG